jgi:hypothetical protein
MVARHLKQPKPAEGPATWTVGGSAVYRLPSSSSANGREQSAERGRRQQNGPRERIHTTAWTGEVEQLQRLGGASDAPFQQREDLQIAAACRTVEDRADLLGELCRPGPVGAGVLLGRKGVALSRPDRAVGQTDLDAWDALIDTDADSKQAQRLDDIWDRRDRWQLLMLGSAHRDGPYPEPTAAGSIASAELARARPPARAIRAIRSWTV